MAHRSAQVRQFEAELRDGVGLTRAAAISLYAELEVLAIYVIVIAVLVARPAGLFGKPVE